MSRHSCPACDTPGGEPLFEARFARLTRPGADGAPTPTDQLDAYVVTPCPACGLVTGRGDFDQPRLDRYYRSLSKYAAHATEAPHDAARFAHVARFLADAGVPRDARIVEIGSTTGGFLAAARDRGFTGARGWEPDAGSVAAARARGLDVHTGTWTDFVAAPGPVDGLVLLHVLEHVVDLAGFVAGLAARLPADGWLFVEVPDAARFDTEASIPFQQFSVEHVNFFSAEALGRLFAPAGFGEVARFQVDREVGRTWVEPAVGVLLRRGAPVRVAPDPAAAAVGRYVTRSTRREAPLRRIVAQWAARTEPFRVWSAGTQCLRLLATSPLGEAPIQAFVDGNPRYAGLSLLGRPIEPPAALAGTTTPILVATTGYAAPILRHIRDTLGPSVEVGLLAEAPAPDP